MQMADDQAMRALEAMSTPRVGDEKLFVRFSMEAEQDMQKSAEMGRPVYREVEYITIQVPGDKDNMPHRPAMPEDKTRFAKQYAAFKSNSAEPLTGTPLSVLPFLSKAQVLEFNAVGLKTAEHIRDMADILGQKFIGIQQVKKRVTDFLAAAEGAAPALKLQSELEKRDQEIKALNQALKEQGEQIQKLQQRR